MEGPSNGSQEYPAPPRRWKVISPLSYLGKYLLNKEVQQRRDIPKMTIHLLFLELSEEVVFHNKAVEVNAIYAGDERHSHSLWVDAFDRKLNWSCVGGNWNQEVLIPIRDIKEHTILSFNRFVEAIVVGNEVVGR